MARHGSIKKKNDPLQQGNIDDLCKSLLRNGWSKKQGKGSHMIFKKPGADSLIIAFHGKGKPIQTRTKQTLKSLAKQGLLYNMN